jgi:cbb3-type cytochrome oxidase cytochrome c subunit/acyl carrier protein
MAVQLAQVANINPREVHPDQPIVRYGLDSPDAIGLALTFEQQLGIPLPPTLFWDYQSLGALAEYVWREHGVTAPTTGPAIDAATQNAILVELLNALYRADVTTAGVQAASSSNGRIKVEIASSADKAALTTAREVGMRYVEELQKGVVATLESEQLRLIGDRYRYALTDVINPARKKAGLKPLDASPVLLAHSKLDQYVDADSKHPMDSIGCTSCHDGSGQETDFVLAAHSPRDIMVDQQTGMPVPAVLLPKGAIEENHDRAALASMLSVVAPEDEVIPKQVGQLQINLGHEAKDAHAAAGGHGHGEAKPVDYVDPVTGKSRKAVTQMAYWKATYEPEAPRNFELVYHEWDWPMRPPKFLEANCARCHSSILDIKDEAPTLFAGRQLFAQQGCVNCHTMKSIPAESMPGDARNLDPGLVMSNNRVKVGPSLTHVSSKLSKEFINTWVWAPKAFRPTTRMPHFFMLENNSSDEELRRTRQEALAITEYLVRMSDPLEPAHPINPALKGSADAGKLVFNSIGCLACHANLNDAQPEKRNGKNISLAEKWVVTDLVKAGALKREMAAREGKDPDDKALRAEAEKLFDSMSYNERQTYVKEHLEEEPGETKEQAEKRRYPDGSVRPIFVHVGPELSGIGQKLTAGRTPEQARQWLFDWVKEPRHYSAYTIMPRLRLNDQQAIDLTEYLLAQKRTDYSPDDKWQAGAAPVDSDKQIELVSLFLRSQFSANTALAKANDDTVLTNLAIDAVKRTTATPDEEKLALADAKQRVAAMNKDEKRMVWLGKKLISHYGCMSCHAINGTERISSPCADLSDWGQKAVDKLGFDYIDPHKVARLPPTSEIEMVNGLSAEAANLAHAKVEFGKDKVAAPVAAAWPNVEHHRNDWLAHKLKNTRVYDRGKELLEPQPGNDDILQRTGKPYDKLKMPTFYLTDEQVHQLVVFVISNRDKLITEKLANKSNTDRAKTIARGRELTTKFNCVSCHWIEQNQPQIQQYYKADELLEKAPPPLRGEGTKVQHAWLFNFFRNVTDLRPLLYQHNGIRMPSFPATDDEWTAIITYFNEMSNKEARDHAAKLDLVIKYVENERAKVKTLPAANPPWAGAVWDGRAEVGG